MQSKPKIMLMGYGRHGKDTVADILRDEYGYRHASSSWTAAKILFPLLRKYHGYRSVEECFSGRHDTLWWDGSQEIHMREVWHEAIKLLNYGDKTTLAKEIYKDNDIYVGIRCKEELKAARKAKLFDFAVWVDASDRVGDTEPESSCTVSKHHSHIVLDNNGTIEELKTNIDKLVIAMETVHYDDNTLWENVEWNV